MFTKTRLNRGCNYPHNRNLNIHGLDGGKVRHPRRQKLLPFENTPGGSRFTRPDDLEARHFFFKSSEACTISIKDRVQWSENRNTGIFPTRRPSGGGAFFKTLDLQPLRASWWQLRQPERSHWRMLHKASKARGAKSLNRQMYCVIKTLYTKSQI